MKSAITTCPQCGRRLSPSDGEGPYCSTCRTAAVPRSTAASARQVGTGLPAASGLPKGISHFLRLFWGDIMALVAIAICAGLLGQLLVEMIVRTW